VRFKDNAHLLHIIEKIVSQVGRRIDESAADRGRPTARRFACQRNHSSAGARWAFVVDSPFRPHVITSDEMITNKTITHSMLKFLAAAVQAKATILISGGTGSVRLRP